MAPMTAAFRALPLLAAVALATVTQAQPTSHPPAKPAPSRQPSKAPATNPRPTAPKNPAATSNPTPRSTPPQGPEGAAPATIVEFADDPYHLESAGLTMLVPVGTRIEASAAGGKSAAQMFAKDQTWMLNVQTPRSSDPDTTTAEVCDRIVTEYFRAAGEIFDTPKPGEKFDPSKIAGVRGKIVEPRKEIKLGTWAADRVYFSVPGAQEKDPAVVRGLTVIKNARNQFLIFELMTTQPAFAKARAVYETTVGTATIQDPTKINAERADAIASARRVMASLGPTACEQVIAALPERWERRYKPAPSGADSDATELGYRRIRAELGTRSMLDGASRNSTATGNKQQGYIIRMDARVLDSGYIIDSQAAFFLAPDASLDKSEEAWTVRNAIRKDGKVETVTEIGARTGKSMVVNVEGTGIASKTIKPVFQGEGYISRVEAWLLPQLLLKAGVMTDFAFYSYQSEASGICLRRDKLEQPSDKPNLYVLTSKLSDDKKPQISYYNSKGELLRTELADGSIWEPVTFNKLVKLWQDKNLPMK